MDHREAKLDRAEHTGVRGSGELQKERLLREKGERLASGQSAGERSMKPFAQSGAASSDSSKELVTAAESTNRTLDARDTPTYVEGYLYKDGDEVAHAKERYLMILKNLDQNRGIWSPDQTRERKQELARIKAGIDNSPAGPWNPLNDS